MSVPAYWPIRMMENSDFAQQFTFLQPDGSPYDISSWVFDLTIWDTPAGTQLYAFPNGAFTNGGDTGILTINELRTVILAALAGALVGYYQLTEVDGGQSLPWFHGPFVYEAAGYP